MKTVTVNRSVGDSGLLGAMEELRDILGSPERLHTGIAHTMIEGGESSDGVRVPGVRAHITEAARTRHKTADALGAEPTGYLERAANAIEPVADGAQAGFAITQSAEIFSRFEDAVPITVQRRKWLTIPIDKRTYGKSPLNFPGMLDFVEIEPDVAALWFMRDKPKGEGKPQEAERAARPERAGKPEKARLEDDEETRKPVFLGLKRVKLTQDKGLLPDARTMEVLVWLAVNNIIDTLS